MPQRRWARKPRLPVRQRNPPPSTSDHVSRTIRYKARKDASKESSDVQSRAMFGRLASRKIEHARYRDLNKIRDEGSRVRLRKEHYKSRQRAVERGVREAGISRMPVDREMGVRARPLREFWRDEDDRKAARQRIPIANRLEATEMNVDAQFNRPRMKQARRDMRQTTGLPTDLTALVSGYVGPEHDDVWHASRIDTNPPRPPEPVYAEVPRFQAIDDARKQRRTPVGRATAAHRRARARSTVPSQDKDFGSAGRRTRYGI